MRKIFSTTNSEIIKQNPYWTYMCDNYVMPNGEIGEYHYVKSVGSVFIIPRAADGKFLMTKQFRYLNEMNSIEFPGGGIVPNLSIEQNAQKELSEEVGVCAEQLTLLGKFNPCNGVTNEICYVFLAEELIPINVEKDPSEQIEVVQMTLQQINNAIKTNLIWDGMTLAAWTLYNSIYINFVENENA